MRRTIGCAAAAILCACPATDPDPPPPRVSEAPPEPAPSPPVAEEPAPVVEPAKPPEPLSLTFSPVVEGHCKHLGVSLVNGETFIHYDWGRLLRAKDGGGFEDLSPSYTQLRMTGIAHFDAIEATGPDQLWARFRQFYGRSAEPYRYLRRVDDKWAPIERYLAEIDLRGAERLYRWTDGQVLGRMECNHGEDECVDSGLDLQVIRGPGQAPRFPELQPARGTECQAASGVAVLPSGEIFAAGHFCHRRNDPESAWHAVRWTPQGGTTIEALPHDERGALAPGPTIAVSPTRVFASASFGGRQRANRTLIAALDGAAWTVLPPLDGALTALDVDAEGRPWAVAGGRLLRGGAGAWDDMSFPTGPVAQVGGLRDAVGWVLEEDGGLWLRAAGEEFVRVVLPPPAFSSTATYRVEAVRTAGRDVWVVASYPEKPPGWKQTEWRRALLHNGPTPEVLRCANTGNDSEPRIFVAWPPPAREGCATPYVVLIRTSTWAPAQFAYPSLGAAIKGRREFADAQFSEVEIGGRRIAGAAVPDVATGHALAERIARTIDNTRPEVVCATPKELRPLPFDLRTGKLRR